MKRVLLLVSSFLIVVSTQQCRTTYSTWGRFLKGHVMSTNNVKNIGQCLDTCKKNQQCQSINFQFRNLVCALNDADRHTYPWDYEFKDGYAYSDYPAKVGVRNNTPTVDCFDVWVWIAQERIQFKSISSLCLLFVLNTVHTTKLYLGNTKLFELGKSRRY